MDQSPGRANRPPARICIRRYLKLLDSRSKRRRRSLFPCRSLVHGFWRWVILDYLSMGHLGLMYLYTKLLLHQNAEHCGPYTMIIMPWCVSKIFHIVRSQCVISLWLSDAMWRHRFGSTLTQVLACCLTTPIHSLRWRHNGRDDVSNHQPHDCLLNRLFRRRSKKTSKLRVTGLCVGNSPGTGEFPAQMASNAENVSIWWRHHDLKQCWLVISGVLWQSFTTNFAGSV